MQQTSSPCNKAFIGRYTPRQQIDTDQQAKKIFESIIKSFCISAHLR